MIWSGTPEEGMLSSHRLHSTATHAHPGVYGAPTHDTAMFTAFADHNAALRRDIPEFLFYSQSIAPMYRGWFDQMAAQ